MKIENVKEKLNGEPFLSLLSPSVFNPTAERLWKRAKKYQNDEKVRVLAYSDEDGYKGIIVFSVDAGNAEILDFAVKEGFRGRGVGSRLVDSIFEEFSPGKIIAETDDGAVDFYRKYGFSVSETETEYDVARYLCVCDSTVLHYDLLIDEGNDPVFDPEPLKAYMDKWDGEEFISQMELNCEKSVLEIGVGTGRLALRVAPKCKEFWGIDLSEKTVERAKENLSECLNVNLVCGDFMSFEFEQSFDVIYSSLTFMHICDKQSAIAKAAGLLVRGGRFVLSTDKNTSEFIDMGTRKVKIYPDREDDIIACIEIAGLTLLKQYETEFATVFVAEKI